MTMYSNPTRATGASAKFTQYVVTGVVILALAGYYLGGIETALSVATRVRYLFAHNPELEQGKSLLQIKDWNGALAAFNQAVEREPDSPAAYNGRAQAELALWMQDEGLNDLKKSISIKPNTEAYLIRSGYLYWAHLEDGGEADSDKALQLEPDNFNALTRHMFIYSKMDAAHDVEEIDNYSRAIKLFPQARKSMSKAEVSDMIYNLYVGRAQRLMSAHRYGEAIDDYNTVFDLGSDSAFMLIMKVSNFQEVMTQLAPDSAEYQGFAKLIKRIQDTGAVVR